MGLCLAPWSSYRVKTMSTKIRLLSLPDNMSLTMAHRPQAMGDILLSLQASSSSMDWKIILQTLLTNSFLSSILWGGRWGQSTQEIQALLYPTSYHS